MDADTRDAITFVLGTIVTVSAIVAMGVKFILLPWLRDHLVGPVAETRRQVSDNGHTSQQPTIPDRLEDLAGKVDDATEAHVVQSRELQALTRVLDEHLRWSDRWVDVIDRELDILKHHRRTETDK